MSGSAEDWAVGCMSGTSVDGLDLAAVATDGVEIREFGSSSYLFYSQEERETIRGAFGRWQGEAGVAEVEEIVEEAHILGLDDFMPGTTVGFHGQTLAHDPDAGRTHQAGNGERLAAETGRRVVWDFRSLDMENGGQGAPLAPFYHFALARFLGLTAPVAFLNLGGVGNMSLVDPSFPAPEENGATVAFDTGPANAIIDDFVRQRTGMPCDFDGKLASAGTPDMDIISEFLDDPWFRKPPPKSLDRDAFAHVVDRAATLSDEDGAATMTAFVAAATRRSLELVDWGVERVLVCGGGCSNPELMRALDKGLAAKVVPVDEIGLDGAMIEAQAFAFLAARVVRGLPTSSPGTTGCTHPVCGGRISEPNGSGHRDV